MVSIRRAESADLPRISSLLRQLEVFLEAAPDAGRVAARAIWAEMAEAPQVYGNLVAEEGEEVVGFVSMICYRTLFHPGGTALINELVVDRDKRGLGIGHALVNRAVELAKAAGMDEIEVGAETTNHGAITFYRRQGFSLEYLLLGRELERGCGPSGPPPETPD